MFLRLLVWLTLLAPAFAAQDVAIRVEVQLVTVLATVKDARGLPVPNLSREDFVVLEEGQPQEVRVFDRQAGTPLAVTLLLDASLSTAKDLRFEQDSAVRFLRSILRPQDRAAVYAFTHDVTQVADFSNDAGRLEKALRAIRPHGGTSLYDAVFLAAEQLKSREGRRVIILVTDGGDTTSTVDYHQALRKAQEADAVIYAVTIVPIPGEAGRNIGGEHALIGLSDGTGGRTFQPRVSSDLDPVFRDIESELRTQYVLGFYAQPSKSRGSYRKLDVRTANPLFTVQARKGYYAREALP
jgi:Ca-activated chloride channel family protein